MLILLHTILRCKVTTFFAYLQIFSKFYVNQKLAGSQKRNKKDQKQFKRKKHKKHCRYNLKRLPARMDMAHAALA